MRNPKKTTSGKERKCKFCGKQVWWDFVYSKTFDLTGEIHECPRRTKIFGDRSAAWNDIRRGSR